MKVFGIFFFAFFLISCVPEVESADESGCENPNFGFKEKLPEFSQTSNLFIIGGGSRSEEMISFLVDSCLRPDASSIIILPWSSSEPDSSAWYAERQFVGFEGFDITSFIYPDSLFEKEVMQIQNADLIYLTGGDQSLFLEVISERRDVKDAILWASKNGGCVAGTSAGAALMSKVMITGDQKLQEEYESTYSRIAYENGIYKEGLGLIEGVVIDQHFVARSRHNRLLTALHDHPAHIGLGIDESTALWLYNGLCRVIGESQVIRFSPPTKTSQVNQKIGLRGVGLDVFLPGEQFTLR